jgi:hypothetical protein
MPNQVRHDEKENQAQDDVALLEGDPTVARLVFTH